jgi:hypothetical protein
MHLSISKQELTNLVLKGQTVDLYLSMVIVSKDTCILLSTM